jgi:hypothetical protein
MNRNSFIKLIGIFLISLLSLSQLQAQCIGCTTTYSTNNATNITVAVGQKICINAGTTLTGIITLNGGTICNYGTLTRITFLKGTFNNYGTYAKVGSSSIEPTSHVIYNAYPNSVNTFSGNIDYQSINNPDSLVFNLFAPTNLSVIGNFNINKGALIINYKNNSGTTFNINKDLNVASLATFKLNNPNTSGYFNVAGNVGFDNRGNKTIYNQGLFNVSKNFNIGGNGQNTGVVTITNFGNFTIQKFFNISYNNGIVNITNTKSNDTQANNGTSEIQRGIMQVGESYTQSKAGTTVTNNGDFIVTNDLNVELGIFINNKKVLARDLDVKQGTFSNLAITSKLGLSRDLITSNANGIINNNGAMLIANELNNKGLINLGQKSAIVTNDLYNQSSGTISGPLSIAGDSTNYAYLEVARISNSAGYLSNYLWINDLTPPTTAIQLDSYGNINRLGGPLVVIGPKISLLCLFSALNYTVNPKPVYCVGTTITITLKPYLISTSATFAASSYTLQSASGNTVNTTGIFTFVINATTSFTGFAKIGTGISSCTKTLPFTLTVNSITADAGPDVFVTSGTNVTLGGAPSALNGLGFYGYSWLPSSTYVPSIISPNPTIIVNTTTTFSLAVTDVFPVGAMFRTCTAKDEKLVYIINEPYYFVLKKTLDAGYYNSFNNKIYFMFEEEYYDPTANAPLNYSIVTDKNASVTAPTLIEKIGDNRFQLTLNSISGLVVGDYYRIKITNEKNEVWYARFKY